MLFGLKSKTRASKATLAPVEPPGKPGIGPTSVLPPTDVRAAPGLELAPEEAKRRAAAAKHIAASFGEAIALLMHLPEYKGYSLADLEWLLMPPLMAGQFSLATAQSKATGAMAPVGLVLWARVSPEVDRRLNDAPHKPIRLATKEWKSGDILWVITAVGDGRVVQGMLRHLQQKDWGHRSAKIMTQAKDGKLAVTSLELKAA